MNRIDCQKCAGKPKKDGCYVCGGYRYVLELCELQCCGKDYWIRPGAHTAYEGKTITSVDGVDMVWSIKRGLVCSSCYGPLEI